MSGLGSETVIPGTAAPEFAFYLSVEDENCLP